MISIYNETNTKWALEDVNEHVIRITRDRHKKDIVTSRILKTRSIRMISYSQILGNIETVAARLRKIVMTPQPVIISSRPSSIIFNRKEFKPFISERVSNNEKDVLFASLFLAGKKIVRIKNKNTFLLEFFMIAGEFSFSASFNSKMQSAMTLDLLDEKTNIVTVYRFTNNDEGNIRLEKTERPFNPDTDGKEFTAKPFRPSKATHAIIVKKKDIDSLPPSINSDNHRLFVVEDNYDDATQLVVAERYHAVTVFINTPISDDVVDDLITSMSKRFNVLFKLFNDDQIFKLKY